MALPAQLKTALDNLHNQLNGDNDHTTSRVQVGGKDWRIHFTKETLLNGKVKYIITAKER